jgi:hypothetical protein
LVATGVLVVLATGLGAGLEGAGAGFTAAAFLGGVALAAGFFTAGLGEGAFWATFFGAGFLGAGFFDGTGFFWDSVFLAGADFTFLETWVFFALGATGLALPWAAFFVFRLGLLTV